MGVFHCSWANLGNISVSFDSYQLLQREEKYIARIGSTVSDANKEREAPLSFLFKEKKTCLFLHCLFLHGSDLTQRIDIWSLFADSSRIQFCRFSTRSIYSELNYGKTITRSDIMSMPEQYAFLPHQIQVYKSWYLCDDLLRPISLFPSPPPSP